MKKLLWLLVLGWGVLALAQPAGRIAFVGPTGRLATIDPDGSELRLLGLEGSSYQFPAWSPDGKQVAASGGDGDGGFVQVFRDVSGETPQELYRSVTEPPFYVYWSPDGQRLSFLANYQGSLALHLAAPAQPDRILMTGSPFYWQWAADAQALLIHTGFSGPASRLGFTSRVADTLADNLAEPGFFQAPGISDSGGYLAYSEITPRGPAVVVMGNPRSSAEVVRREVPHQGLSALAWRPGRDDLAIMSPTVDAAVSYGPLQLLEAETGLLTSLTDRTALAFFWSPDGRYLAYLTLEQGAGDDFADQAGPRAVVQGPAFMGLRLLEPDSGSDTLLTTFIPSPQFVGQFLPFFDQYALSHRLWSPGGDAIVLPFVDLDAGVVQVAVIRVSGEVTYVAEGDMAFWSPR